MTPQSLPELETGAFRRSIAVALGLPIEGEPPRTPANGASVVDPSRGPAAAAPAAQLKQAA